MTVRLLALVMLLLTTPAIAQTPLDTRAADLVAMLRTGAVDEAAFAPSFVKAVPPAQLTTLLRQVVTDNGKPIAPPRMTAESASQAVVEIELERGTISARIAIEPVAPNRFIGLLITGIARRDDSFAKIEAELRALPGTTALLVQPIGGTPVASLNADTPLAVGSVFKLWVLVATTDSVDVGSIGWDRVVTLGQPSLPGGEMRNWPTALPVTVGTLATAMIAASDNTATDTLMSAVGREAVDAARSRDGAIAQALPVLSTLEAFTLKAKANSAARQSFVNGSTAARRAVLPTLPLDAARLDMSEYAGDPLHIDTIEWPARLTEIASALKRFATAKPTLAADILAINPALPDRLKARFAYVGYKGGSESGVIAQSWLLRTRGGAWWVVAGTWNNTAAPVDDGRFAMLMQRAVALVR